MHVSTKVNKNYKLDPREEFIRNNFGMDGIRYGNQAPKTDITEPVDVSFLKSDLERVMHVSMARKPLSMARAHVGWIRG